MDRYCVCIGQESGVVWWVWEEGAEGEKDQVKREDEDEDEEGMGRERRWLWEMDGV